METTAQHDGTTRGTTPGRATLGVMLPRDLDAGRVLEFARLADELGFDELWVVEDLGFRGGIAQAGAVLAATRRIRVGIGILPAAARNAAYEAMELATLEQLFPGRVVAGIGHGMPDWMRSVGAWPAHPLALLEAHVTAVTALFRGETVDDERAGMRGVALEAACVPATPPPVLLGVRGPKSLALSGRIADGTVLAEPTTPEYARAALEAIGATTAGTATGPAHSLVAYNVAAVADDPAEAVAAVRPALEWIGDPGWAPHIAPLEFAHEFAELRASAADRAEFAARLPEEWVTRLALAGTPEQVRLRLAELAGAGVTSSVLILAGPDPFAAARAAARLL